VVKKVEKQIEKMHDIELVKNLKLKVGEEKKLVAEVLRYLEEVNRRRLFVEYGTPSMFKFCTRVLGYSEAEAALRLKAMRVTKVVPKALEKVQNNEVTLSGLASLQTFLAQNPAADGAQTLDLICGKSARETEKILGELSDNPPPRQLKINLPERVLKKLEKLQSDFAGCSELEILEALIDERLREKGTTRPLRAVRGSKLQRHVSRTSKEMVWARAQGRCEGMVGEGGKRQRCEACVYLEFDHIRPIAEGGGGEMENLQLLCSACNQRKLIKSVAMRDVVGRKNGLSASCWP